MTAELLQDMLLLHARSRLQLLFNGWDAGASVNQFHMQGFYEDSIPELRRLPLPDDPLEPVPGLRPGPGLSVARYPPGSPKTGFVFAPAVESGLPAVESGLPAVESGLPAVESGLPAVESGLPAVESGLPAVESGLPAVESGLPAVESGLPAVESGLPAVESGLPAVENGLPAVDASAPAVESGCRRPPPAAASAAAAPALAAAVARFLAALQARNVPQTVCLVRGRVYVFLRDPSEARAVRLRNCYIGCYELAGVVSFYRAEDRGPAWGSDEGVDDYFRLVKYDAAEAERILRAAFDGQGQ